MLNDISSGESVRDESLVLGVLFAITNCEEIGSLVFERAVEVFGFFKLGCLSIDNARGLQMVERDFIG